MKNVVNRALVAEKKNYIQPELEVLTVNAISNLCAVSITEGFSIVSPYGDGSGDPIGADSGR